MAPNIHVKHIPITGIHMFFELLSIPIRHHIASCTEMRDSDKDLLEAEVGRIEATSLKLTLGYPGKIA